MQSIWYDIAGIVYGMALCAWHVIWYDPAGIVCVCMAWEASHGL